MPTFDITRTALSALIFFCFLLVKERPLEINYDLKLVNLVTCIFFHKLPQPPYKALYNLKEKRATESGNCKYPTSSIFRPGVLKLGVSCPHLRLCVTLHRRMCGAICSVCLYLCVHSVRGMPGTARVCSVTTLISSTRSGARGVFRVAESLFFPLN